MVTGYKAFHKGLIGHNKYQFKEGETFIQNGELQFCRNGFHFCVDPRNIEKYYPHTNTTEYAIIEALGNVLHDGPSYKSITNKIKIIKVLTYAEFNEVIKTFILESLTSFGYEIKLKNGKFHSDNDEPSIITPNGSKYWCKNGFLQRDNDLPTIETKEYMTWGTGYVYVNENKKDVKNLIVVHNQIFTRNNNLPALVHIDGTKRYYRNGKLHRDNNLPAIESCDGSNYYYVNGKLHRDNDLPAIELPDGTKEWYQHGKRHRSNNQPAIEQPNGYKFWYQGDQIIKTNIINVC